MKIYRCTHCGNIVAFLKDAGVPLFCCGQKMELLVPGSVDAAQEKHVPVAKVEGHTVEVTVGAVDHRQGLRRPPPGRRRGPQDDLRPRRRRDPESRLRLLQPARAVGGGGLRTFCVLAPPSFKLIFPYFYPQ